MKVQFKYFTLLLLTITTTTVFAQYKTLIHDELERTYLVHLPENYNNSNSLPLIIAFHGGFGNAYNIESQSTLSIKADKENFIAVYPEGVKGGILQIRTWNAGWCCGYASNNEIDDIGFISKLIDQLVIDYKIDPSKIFLTGMSNGGFMCYRLACELPEKITGIAPVACSMSIEECDPIKSTPIIHFHSYQDTNIPYLGGIGNGTSNHYNIPQDELMNTWTNINNCNNSIDSITHNEEYTFTKRKDCSCNQEIHHYITQDGGHSWPGGVKTIIGDEPSLFINATDIMWDFFKNIDCEINAIEIQNEIGKSFNIYPNPSINYISIEGLSDSKSINIMSIDGNTSYTTSMINGIIPIDHLMAGIYLLSFNNNKNTIIKKLIVTNE